MCRQTKAQLGLSSIAIQHPTSVLCILLYCLLPNTSLDNRLKIILQRPAAGRRPLVILVQENRRRDEHESIQEVGFSYLSFEERQEATKCGAAEKEEIVLAPSDKKLRPCNGSVRACDSHDWLGPGTPHKNFHRILKQFEKSRPGQRCDFASKYALESSRRGLQNALLCTVLEAQFFI